MCASTEPYRSLQTALWKSASECVRNTSLEKVPNVAAFSLVVRRVLSKKRNLLEEHSSASKGRAQWMKNYCGQRKEYKYLINGKKDDHKKAQIGLLRSAANDPQAFCDQIGKHRRKLPVTNSITREDWFAHFETLFNSHVENLPAEHSEADGEPSVFDEFLDSDITEDEVSK